MIRKTLIVLSAAATMALGIAVTSAPAEAHHRHHHFGGIFIIGHHWRPWHCHTYRVWHHHHWVWVKKCHRHY